MITLHYHPGNANLAPHMLLEELGVPFELVLVDRGNAAHKSPEFLKLNPNGKIPVLVDGDLVLFETAAICLHLVDSHPAVHLAPPLATPERAHFYKWLIWSTNTLQAMLMHFFYGDRLVDDGNASGAAQVKAHAEAQIGGMLDLLDRELASHRKPWLLGDAYSGGRPVRADAGPMDAKLREAGAKLAESRTLSAARAGAARRPAGIRYGEARATARLKRAARPPSGRDAG